MSIPKVCGLETEYGLLVAKPQALDQEDAALALLHYCPISAKVPWETSGESPWRDARYQPHIPPVSTLELSSADNAGYMLGNGARLYVDHGHPEYATPECTDALALVASDKAGEWILERCRQQVSRFLPQGQSVQLFKNNSDHQGHSYGCHENYLVAAELYETLFQPKSKILYAHLIPFLISRQVVCGAGKVGSENRQPAIDYQISQRADFFETLLGLQTMSHRPIVNTRDEAHADRTRFRRLHVITGDANMAELSTYLKVSTMQLLLAMLEDNTPLPDLTLSDPVAALIQISHDPTCQHQVLLADGRRFTAVEIQLLIAEAAQRYVESGQYGGEGLFQWITVLQKLQADPMQLHDSLDWIIKWKFLQEWQARKNLHWSAAELKELDIRYHDIHRENSIFYLLVSSGKIRQLVSEKQIETAVTEPLSPTRAAVRAGYMKEQGDQMQSASWGTLLSYENQEKTNIVRKVLMNPI